MSFLDSPIIQVALGLVLLYFALAVACLGVNEAIAQKLGLRAECLWRAVKNLVGDATGTGFAKDLYQHHLISSMMHKPEDAKAPRDANAVDSKPSYISGDVFATAFTDELGMDGSQGRSLADLDALLDAKKVPDGVKSTVLALARGASGSLDEFHLRLASWFDAAMDRASGWYRRRMRSWSLYVGCLIVLAANADTITAGAQLWRQPALRQQVAAQAQQVGADKVMPTEEKQVQAGSLPGLLGWHGNFTLTNPGYGADDMPNIPPGLWRWLYKLLGLAITAGMVSMGAPFWFDILNRFGSISSSGSKPPSTQTGPRPAGERT